MTPLFQQLGKGGFELPDDQVNAQEVDDFKGYLVEAFALRGRAGKLGYTRGQSEDGGWFYTYDKRFPTLGITAQVAFSGNGLPEENRTVALTALSFQRHGARAAPATRCDCRRCRPSCSPRLERPAADGRRGPGFDPDWEKKVEY